MTKQEFNEKSSFYIRDLYLRQKGLSDNQKIEQWFDDTVLSLTNNTSKYTDTIERWKSDPHIKTIILSSWLESHSIRDISISHIVIMVRNNADRFRTTIIDETSQLYGCNVFLEDVTDLCCWNIFGDDNVLKLCVEVSK